MKFTLDQDSSAYRIRRYDKGIIQINDVEYRRSLILSPDRLIPDWPPTEVSAITAKDCAVILELDPEIILLGTGNILIFPEPDQLQPIYRSGKGIEIMDTAAACRTFMVLSAEHRKVVAALILEN